MFSLNLQQTLTLAAGWLISACCVAQTLHSTVDSPQFEVAIVRPNLTALPENGFWNLPNTGSFTASGVSIAVLIRLAYDIDDKQIVNRPDWLNQKLYDINAKPEEGVVLTRAELHPRLQNLLQQRFHLVAHRETRETAGFVLAEAKHGAKLQSTKGSKFPDYHVELHAGKINLRNVTLNNLAASITSVIDKPVVNVTAIAGSYDVDVTYAPSTDSDSNLPSIFTALDETLGLRLVPRKVPVSVLVIDSVDATPTAN